MIELLCPDCGHLHEASRADMLRLPPAMYRRCPACRSSDDAPRVPATAVWSDRSGIWTLTLVCPHCGKRHSHGGGSGPEPDLGHRLSHCLDRANPGYILIAAEKAESAA